MAWQGTQERSCNPAGLIREQWSLPGRRLCPQLTQLPRQSSDGNMLLPKCQAAGCALLLHQVLDGCSEYTRGRCAPAEELLSLVAELREEVIRLRSIRESEREIDYWNHTPPSLGRACQADRTQDMEDSLSFPHLAEHGDLRDRGEWQQVPA